MANSLSSEPPRGSAIRLRDHYLDNYRSFLVICVILLHTSIAYGGPGAWMYHSRLHSQSTTLLVFNAVVATFTLGAFFFISGHLSALSIKRKNTWQFVGDKLLRLGVPAVLYTIFLAPLAVILQRMFLPSDETPTSLPTIIDMYLEQWRKTRGIRGPVWYCVALLAFDCFYAIVWRRLFSSPPNSQEANAMESQTKKISGATLLTGILAVVVSSFIVRLRYPISYRDPVFNICIGTVPQFIGAYALGHAVSSPSDVSDALANIAWPLLIINIPATIILFGYFLRDTAGMDRSIYAGGFNGFAAAYAAWNDVTGFLMFARLLRFFQKYCNSQWGSSSRYSYGAFLVHPPTCVAIMVALDSWWVPGVLKAVIVGGLSILASWFVAWPVVLMPGLRNIL